LNEEEKKLKGLNELKKKKAAPFETAYIILTPDA
jgi:hypothetical protein